MKTIDFINEKGNVNATIRAIVRKQVQEQWEETLIGGFDEGKENAIGGYSIPIAVDRRSGDEVLLHIDFAISNKEKVKPAKKSKAGADTAKKTVKDEPEVPNLFGEDEDEIEEDEIEENEDGEAEEVSEPIAIDTAE